MTPTMPVWLSRFLATLPDTEIKPSRVGDSDSLAGFKAGKEFVHLHGEHVLDIRLPRSLQKDYGTDPRATFRPHRSDWMEYAVPTPAARKTAKELIRRAHAGTG